MAHDARYSTKEWRKKCEEIFREHASFASIARLVDATMRDAEHGDPDARRLVWPYLFGARPQALTIEGNVDLNLIDWTKPWSPPQLPPHVIIDALPSPQEDNQ